MDTDAAQGKEPNRKQRKTPEQSAKARVDGDDLSDVNSNDSEVSGSKQACGLTPNVRASWKAASGTNRKMTARLFTVKNLNFHH